MTTTPEPIGDAFERAVAHWRRSHPADRPVAKGKSSPPPLTIAISREAGSGGRRIGAALATKLNWPIYDRELVEQIAKDTGRRAEMIESVDERQSSFLVETLEAFTGVKTLGGAGYAYRLHQTLAGLGAHGQCVIIGRGATAILPKETTISIKMVAALDDRVAEYAQREQVSERVAKTKVQRLDRERAEFVKNYFHKEIDDPHLYDLVINTSRYTDQECVELILLAVEQRQRSQRGPDSRG